MNGKIYTFGGFTSSVHKGAGDVVFEYDPVSDTWRTLPPMKGPRASVGVAVIDGKIHVIGGRGHDAVTVATHEVYDPANAKWSEAAPLPRPRDHMAVIAVVLVKMEDMGRRSLIEQYAKDIVRDPLYVLGSSGAATGLKSHLGPGSLTLRSDSASSFSRGASCGTPCSSV